MCIVPSSGHPHPNGISFPSSYLKTVLLYETLVHDFFTFHWLDKQVSTGNADKNIVTTVKLNTPIRQRTRAIHIHAAYSNAQYALIQVLTDYPDKLCDEECGYQEVRWKLSTSTGKLGIPHTDQYVTTLVCLLQGIRQRAHS